MTKFARYLWYALVGLTLFSFTLFLLLSLMSFLLMLFVDLDPMSGDAFYRGGVHFFYYAAFIGAMMILGILISRYWRRERVVRERV